MLKSRVLPTGFSRTKTLLTRSEKPQMSWWTPSALLKAGRNQNSIAPLDLMKPAPVVNANHWALLVTLAPEP
jgi:hypothetical protein